MNGKQVGRTSGQHDKKDNRGSKGREREGDVRFDKADKTKPGGQPGQSSMTRTPNEPGQQGREEEDRLTKSGRQKRPL